jgi:murein DD-endopeptidase MepM/ murein hydrolase activator NlpD
VIAWDPWTLVLFWLFWPKPGPKTQALRLAAGMTAFPVSVDAASFSNDYAAEDSPGRRKHLGIDIFADAGTAVLAPEGGTVTFTTDPVGGMVFYLTGASGMRYYGAHLRGYIGKDRDVRAGEQIGFVGTTGNARGGPAHLHFQMAGGTVNPYPFLKRLAPNAPEAPWARKERVA